MRSVRAVFAAIVLTACAVPVGAAETPRGIDFTGVIRLSGCSASLVRTPTAADGDKAIMLTNGHCVREAGMPGPGVVYVDKPSRMTMTLLGGTGPDTLGTLRATRLVYATMTDTDLALYELDTTYDRIARELGGTPLTLADTRPSEGRELAVVSGYHARIWNCSLDHHVYRLREQPWEWKDSLAYNQGCTTVGGTSGSPVVDAGTNEVIGVHNTGNEGGEPCRLQNPCEVNENGEVFAERGRSYGQNTWWVMTCWTDGRLDLAKEGCLLPKPRR